jgi:hypothetical protein
MRNRLIVLVATVALLLVGAVPVSAAPGGVPGPPPGHGKSADNTVAGDVGTPDGEKTKGGPPEWAMAYGKRIKDYYGIPFGHLQQCARAPGDEEADGDEIAADDITGAAEDDAKKALEACAELPEYEFPEGEPGAKAFAMFNEALWVFPESALPIVGV